MKRLPDRSFEVFRIEATLRNLLDDLEGEVTPEVDRLIQQLFEARTESILSIALHCDNLDGTIDMLKAKERQLRERRQRHERRLEWLRQYQAALMKAEGLKRFDIGTHTLSLVPGRMGVNIVNEEMVPERFLKTTTAPDKKAIHEELKAGNRVPGAIFEVGPDYVRMTK